MERDRSCEQLNRFVELLLRWNPVVKLVARGDEAKLWDRHVADALQLIDFIPADTERAIDLGSGGGFPGLVLSIATGIPWELVEADSRKASFLREAARVTGARIKVHPVRLEAVDISPALLLTTRGLGPLAELLPHCRRLLKPAGVCIFPKGKTAEQELTRARLDWQMQVERVASRTAKSSTILLISDIHPATSSE